MTEQDFFAECSALGLTHREESDAQGRIRYVIVETDVAGQVPCWFKQQDGFGYVLGWSWSFERYQSVLEAILAAQADGMPIIVDPIRIAGLAYTHQREDEGPRGS